MKLRETAGAYGIPIFKLELVRDSTVRIRDRESITSSYAAIKLARKLLKGSHCEHLFAFFLDNQNRFIGLRQFEGTVNQVAIYPREIFLPALLCNSTSLILLHNHPSGILKPSNEDFRLNESLKTVSKLLQLALLDHIILGEEGQSEYYSFHESRTL